METIVSEAISKAVTIPEHEIEKQSTALITQVEQLKIAGNDDRLLAEDLVQALMIPEKGRMRIINITKSALVMQLTL